MPQDPARRTLRVLLLVVALALTGAVVVPASAERPRGRPDLTVPALKAPDQAQAGAGVAATVTVRNVGRRVARATRVRVRLSVDARPGNDVATRTAKVRRLGPGDRTRVKVHLTVPADAAAGDYRLIACADATRLVRERRETNNCRSTTIRVTSAAPAPDPVSASDVVLDTGAAVTRMVDPADPASLVVSATGTDGTLYELRLPAEALLSAEEITLTPLAGATLPVLSGGLKSGVRLEPEGLMLQAPAILTIVSPDAGPVAEQVPFSFHGDGDDFHEHPIARPEPGDDSSTVRLSLTHFSVAGVGGGTAADRSALAEHVPVRSSAQLESTMAGSVNDARRGGDFSAVEAQGALVSYYDNVVDPQLEAAETNAELAAGAIAEAIAVLRQLALLGDEDSPIHERVKNRLKPILDNLVQHWWSRCTAQNDIMAVPMLIAIARQRLLLGIDSDDSSLAFDYARRCASFDVELDSTVDWVRDHDPTPEASYDGNVHLRLTATAAVEFAQPGYGVLDYTESALEHHYRVTDDGSTCTPCTIDTTLTDTVPGWMKADVLVRANPRDPGPENGPALPPVPYLRLDPGIGPGGVVAPPQEQVHEESQPQNITRDYATTEWVDLMLTWSHGYPLMWEYDLQRTSGQPVLLEESIDEVVGSVTAITGQATTSTTFTVTHTPE